MPRERHGGRPTAATSSPTPRSSSSSSSSSRSSSRSSSSSSSSSSSYRPSASRTTSSRSSERSTPSYTSSYRSPPKTDYVSRSSGGSPFSDGFSSSVGEGAGRGMWEALFGPRKVKVEVSEASPVAIKAATSAPAPVHEIMGPSSCHPQAKSFLDCLGENEADISKCQFYMGMLSRLLITS